jgi:hypothetical protein
MDRTDVVSLMADLSSNEVEIQIPALDKLCELVGEIVESSVVALRHGPERFLVAERLPRLGSVAVGPLERLLKETQDEETQILASLVLLRLRSRTGVPRLLEAVMDSHEYSGLAANLLAESKVIEVADRIVMKLRSADPTDIDLIVSLLNALKVCEVALPSDLRQKFSNPSLAWQIRTMIQ